MSADPVGYTMRGGVWVPTPAPGLRLTPPVDDNAPFDPTEPRWNGWYWVRGTQYTTDQSPEDWAAGVEAVLGPEDP
jgi:hypothetical protein